MFGFTLDTATILGLLAVCFTIASVMQKRMVSLRVLSLVANVLFIAYGLMIWVLPSIILNAALLPLNARRLWEIKKLTKEISKATHESPVSQWLLPHMRQRKFKAGDVLFRKGEKADKLIYIAQGELKLAEIGKTIGPGELLGEIGLFSPDNQRTQTLVAETSGESYEMTGEMLFQLYYQNPKLGFYMMRLVTERLLRDVQRQQAQPVAVVVESV